MTKLTDLKVGQIWESGGFGADYQRKILAIGDVIVTVLCNPVCKMSSEPYIWRNPEIFISQCCYKEVKEFIKRSGWVNVFKAHAHNEPIKYQCGEIYPTKESAAASPAAGKAIACVYVEFDEIL